ncbi:MAG: tetratricopeptide repeat protein, partial [Planctomycetaceae bacterium]|nr:tetratricopeptide repeat protein [Planctomycetaceae bacterium]
MSSRPSHYLIIIAVVLFLGALALFLTLKAPPQQQNRPNVLGLISYEKAEELPRFKNEGIAYLENERYTDSDALLERLTEELPTQQIGFRDLTICRLLQLTPEKVSAQPEGQELAQQALETVNQLIKIAPDSAVSYVLSARIYGALGQTQQALKVFQRAIEQDPQDAAIWFELSQVQKQSDNPGTQKTSNESLAKAWELQPENLFLSLDYLQVVADQKSAQATPVFEKIKQLAAPLADSVKDHTRLDLNKLIDDSLTAIKEQQWNVVLRNARIMRNVLIAEDLVKSDRRRVEQNPLEFVIHDFPPAFYAAVEWPVQQKPLSVQFADPSSLKFANESPSDIKDLQIADFDLDGKPDLIVLTVKQVSVFKQSANGAWELITQQECGGD